MSFDAFAYDVTVAKDGSGNYTTVQAAVDAAPTGRTAAYTIFIKNGTYKEIINVPSNKPFLQFVGESVANTMLTYDNYSGKAFPVGGTYGTSNSASVTINAPDFTAVNITFENTTGEQPQALAINVNNDRCAFYNCRFLGGQFVDKFDDYTTYKLSNLTGCWYNLVSGTPQYNACFWHYFKQNGGCSAQ